MKTLFSILLAIAVVASPAISQVTLRNDTGGSRVVRAIKIRHADPALIALLMKNGQHFTSPPEISSLQKPRN